MRREGLVILLIFAMVIFFFSLSFAVELKATPMKAVPATTLKPSEKVLYDLSIDRIYLNEANCKIHVVLRNLGMEKIPDEVFKAGRLKIISEYFKNVSWSLSHVDSGKELNGSRKLKDFDTGLVLNHKERVTFRLENLKDKEAFDNSKTVDLTASSKCLQARTGLPAVVQMKPLPSIEPMREVTSPEIIRRAPPIVHSEPPTHESSDLKIATPPKTGVSIGSTDSPSITVISPSKGDVLKPGSNFTIRWKATGIADLLVAIDLFLPGTQLTPSNYQKTWSYLVEVTPNDGAYDWENISFSTPYQGPLQIRIRTIDGKAYGDSDIFSIGIPPKEGK